MCDRGGCGEYKPKIEKSCLINCISSLVSRGRTKTLRVPPLFYLFMSVGLMMPRTLSMIGRPALVGLRVHAQPPCRYRCFLLVHNAHLVRRVHVRSKPLLKRIHQYSDEESSLIFLNLGMKDVDADDGNITYVSRCTFINYNAFLTIETFKYFYY